MELYLTSRRRIESLDCQNFEPEDMPVETVLKALDVASTAKDEFVYLKCNEPLLYPFLEQLFSSAAKRHVGIIPETTGLIPTLARDLVVKNCQSIFIKLYRDGLYSEDDKKEIQENTDEFIKANIKISIVCPVDDFAADYSNILDFAKKNNLREILFRLPCRRPMNAMRPFIKWYCENLRKNLEEGLVTGVDCGLMRCAFTDEELGIRERIGFKTPACCPHLGVMPSGLVCHCWELTGLPGPHINTIKSVEEFRIFYYDVLKDLQWQMDRFPACRDCISRFNNTCYGLSMATKRDLVQREYDLLSDLFKKEDASEGAKSLPPEEREQKLWQLGTDAMILTHHADAIECYEELRALHPEDWKVHGMLANSYWECGRFKESEEEFRKASRLGPDPVPPLVELYKRFSVNGNAIKARLLQAEIERLVAKKNG